jgi:hypothetical protein
MTLPTGMSVGLEEIEDICQIIRFAIANGPEISHKLARQEA